VIAHDLLLDPFAFEDTQRLEKKLVMKKLPAGLNLLSRRSDPSSFTTSFTAAHASRNPGCDELKITICGRPKK